VPLSRAERASALRRAGLEPRLLGMVAVLGLVWGVLHQASDGLFLSPRNLYNLAVQSSVVAVMACGMVGVIVARHIDLSVGSMLGFCGMLVATLQADWMPDAAAHAWPWAVIAAVACGAALGAAQGYFVAYAGLPAFVVTLGGLLMLRGAAYLLTDGRTVAPLAPGFVRLGGGVEGAIGAGWSWALGALASAVVILLALRTRRERTRHGIEDAPAWLSAAGAVLRVLFIVGFVAVMNAHTLPRSEIARGIPIPVLILLVVALGAHLLMAQTRFGRHVFAIGGSPSAAGRAGIDVARVSLLLFVWMGALAGVAGVMTSARLAAGTNSMGTLAELAVIAAAVIGGTSLAGGVGSVAGALLGAVFMQSLESGMVLLGVDSAARQVVIGAVLVGAVWLDSRWTKQRGLS
jgi:D-xylose transport system permease protein